MSSSTKSTAKTVVLGSERHLGGQISAYFRDKRGGAAVSGLNTKSLEKGATGTSKITVGKKKGALWTDQDHLICAVGTEVRQRDRDFDHHEEVVGAARKIADILKENPPARFTLLTSTEAYKQVEGALIDETTPVDQADPWCLGQLHFESEIQEACKAKKIPLLICRVGKFYGPGDENPIFGPAQFVRQALARKPIELYSRATEKDDFIYTQDICLILELLTFNSTTGLLNIVSGTSISYLEIAKEVCELAASRGMGPKILVPDNTFAAQISGPLPHTRYNIAKLLSTLGPFQFTPMSKGLREYFNWLGIPNR